MLTWQLMYETCVLHFSLFIHLFITITYTNDCWRRLLCAPCHVSEIIAISFKLGKCYDWNELTSSNDMVPDIDSILLVHFPHHCRIGHVRLISLIQSLATFRESRRNDLCQQGNYSCFRQQQVGLLQ